MLRRSATLRILLFLGLIFFLFAAGSGAKKKAPEKPVNINSASAEELQTVPGIGPVTAEKILKMRKSNGAFKSVDDLLAIRGLGPKRLEKMRKYLTVGKAVAPKSKGSPPSATDSKPSPTKAPDKP
jgi:competence ComEA-like helix-hairpin-helix protein